LKKIIVLAAIFMASFFLFSNEVQAEEQPKRSIAVHDRVLSFEEGEVRLVDGKMVARLEKFAAGIYADVKWEDPIITITKHEHEFTYNRKAKVTTWNGEQLVDSPIIEIDGQFYIQVRFFGEATGFKVDYLSDILTARLTRETYPSLSNKDFIHKWKEDRKPVASGPTVYLTFDDGPNDFTLRNMETLQKYGVKATFFFVGKQINLYPNIVKATAKDGHTLGVHSMTHDRSKVYASSKAFIGEMNTARELINKLTGFSPTIARAPYGSKPYVTGAMRNELVAGKYKLWDWDVDSNDWKYSVNEYQQIIANVKEGVRKSRANDQHIVVLLHDRAQTAKALPEILTWLKAEGFNIESYDPSRHVVQNFLKDNDL